MAMRIKFNTLRVQAKCHEKIHCVEASTQVAYCNLCLVVDREYFCIHRRNVMSVINTGQHIVLIS